MKLKKEINLLQKSTRSGCDESHITDYYDDPGPNASAIKIWDIMATIEGVFMNSTMMTEDNICFVEILDKTSLTLVWQPLVIQGETTENSLKIKFYWKGLTPNTTYSNLVMHIHFGYNSRQYVHYKDIDAFTTAAGHYQPWIKTKVMKVTTTTADFQIETYSGQAYNGTYFSWTEKALIERFLLDFPKKYSNRIPTDGYDILHVRIEHLIPNTSYSDFLASDYVNIDQLNKLTGEAPTFKTAMVPVRKAWIKASVKSTGKDYAVLLIETYSGHDGFNNYYNFNEEKGISLTSDTNPDQQRSKKINSGHDSITFRLVNLEPNTIYDDWKANAWMGKGYYHIPRHLITDVPSFKTSVDLLEKPYFTIINNVVDNSVRINYLLNLGSDNNGDPFELKGKVELYDQNDQLLDSKNNTKNTFTVNNLSNGTYEGWYLSAKTSYRIPRTIGKIDTFTIDIGDIIEPQFSDYAVVTSDTSVEVSYQFNLGKDPNGDPYDLIGLIVLYNDKKQPIDSSDKIGDTLKANNLTPNTTYSDWSLEAYTTYSTEAVNQPIGDFTTTSRKTTIKNN